MGQFHYLYPSAIILFAYCLTTQFYLNTSSLKLALPVIGFSSFILGDGLWLARNPLYSISWQQLFLSAIILAGIWLANRSWQSTLAILFFSLTAQSVVAITKPSILQNSHVSTSAGKQIASKIYRQTRWTTQQMAERTLIFTAFPERDITEIYDHVSHHEPKPEVSSDSVSGYIVIEKNIYKNLQKKMDIGDQEREPQWRSWLKSGELRQLQEDVFDNFVLIAYHRENRSLPKTIQNIGEPYPRVSGTFAETHRSDLIWEFTVERPEIERYQVYFNAATGSVSLHGLATARLLTVGRQTFLDLLA
jgi:hypothetical protein